MKSLLIFVTFLSCVCSYGRPKNAFLSTTEPTTTITSGARMEDANGSDQTEEPDEAEDVKTIIQSFHITSNIQFRYAHTVVEAYMKNPSSKPREVFFSVVLPESAFVSNFSMILPGNQEFVAKVMEKSKAKDIYKEALQTDEAAGLVQSDSRNANQMVVSVNVGPRGKAKFRLTYEDLLKRHLSKYQHVIHVNLNQVVDDFRVQVFINESLPVVRVHVPEFKTDPNAIDSQTNKNQHATVEQNIGGSPSKVKITFQPDSQLQKQMLENQDDKEGIHGQFIVDYDVDRKSHGNEVQVLDGYFVHFFAPDSLGTLPKHVVFVLDISGSMYGEKLQQTKDAMITILDDLTERDHFNILTFSDYVTHWVPDSEKNLEAPHALAHKGTKELRDEALRYVLKLYTLGGTNIHDAMIEALKLVTEVRRTETSLPRNTNPIIVFLTDGEPTTGITSGPEIEQRILEANEILEVPIYGLAFGKSADFALVKSISVKSGAYARKIFEGSDAAIQLEDFYLELANPLLTNVKFRYVGEPFKNASITNTNFKTYFKGSEYVIAGKIAEDNIEAEEVQLLVGGEGEQGAYAKKFNLCFLRSSTLENNSFNLTAIGAEGPLNTNTSGHCTFSPTAPKSQPERSTSQNFIERLWAFLTIKNLLSDKISQKERKLSDLNPDNSSTSGEPDSDEDQPYALPSQTIPSQIISKREQALQLALKYNFVTKLTSLVVTRPLPLPGKGDAKNNFQNSSDFNPEIVAYLGPVSEHHDSHQHWSRRRGLHSRLASRLNPNSGLYQSMQAGQIDPTFGRFSLNNPSPVAGTSNYNNLGKRKSKSRHLNPAVPAPKHAQSLFAVSNVDANDLADDGRFLMKATNIKNAPCTGQLMLFTQTYLRGANLTSSVDIPDLRVHNFEDKVTSLQVSGTCCWVLFSEPQYRGHSQHYKAGLYKSAADIGQLFRDVSSVKNIGGC